MNFLLNTGDTACPSEIPVLTVDNLDSQINSQTADFIQRNTSVDISKRTITIPKMCEVFRNDFAHESTGSVADVCLRFCLVHLDEPTVGKINSLLQDGNTATIKYRHSAEHYHTILTIKNLDEQGIDLVENVHVF